LCYQIKRKYFSLPLFGVYLIFFVFFNNFGKRIKECYVTKEESSVTNILVPSAWYTRILREKGHMKEKDSQEKSSRGQRCKDVEAKCYRACV
jgi:hypothetical protein